MTIVIREKHFVNKYSRHRTEPHLFSFQQVGAMKTLVSAILLHFLPLFSLVWQHQEAWPVSLPTSELYAYLQTQRLPSFANNRLGPNGQNLTR